MLTEDHIGAALQLLKKQCPKMCGLQNPVLGAVLQFAVASGPFVQILDDSDLHWVTVATPPSQMAADVILYNSLNDRVNTHCKKQIASLPSRTPISVRCVVDTSQRQSEVTDCGLFAITAATSVCFRDFTSGSFDQAAMRGHFRVYIQRGAMTPFPSTVTTNHASNLQQPYSLQKRTTPCCVTPARDLLCSVLHKGLLQSIINSSSRQQLEKLAATKHVCEGCMVPHNRSQFPTGKKHFKDYCCMINNFQRTDRIKHSLAPLETDK